MSRHCTRAQSGHLLQRSVPRPQNVIFTAKSCTKLALPVGRLPLSTSLLSHSDRRRLAWRVAAGRHGDCGMEQPGRPGARPTSRMANMAANEWGPHGGVRGRGGGAARQGDTAGGRWALGTPCALRVSCASYVQGFRGFLWVPMLSHELHGRCMERMRRMRSPTPQSAD